MSSIDPHPLLAKVDEHLAITGLSKSAFGEKAVGDPNFVFELEAGREPRRMTVQRVEAFIRSAVSASPSRQPRPGKKGATV